MPETFTTTNERGREVDHERLSADEETEAHLAAYEQHANDPNLVRLLRHLGSELMKVRGGGEAGAAKRAEDDAARKQREDADRRRELQRQLDALDTDGTVGRRDTTPPQSPTPAAPASSSGKSPKGDATATERSDA